MKTFLLLATLLWVSASNKTFANEENNKVPVSYAVMQSFKNSFSNATNIQWSVVDRLYRAEFTLDDEKTIAFFSIEDGALVATCRYLTLSELSHTLQRSLKTAAGSGNITEIFEVQNDNDADYFATVQNGNQVTVLKAAAANWNVYKKS